MSTVYSQLADWIIPPMHWARVSEVLKRLQGAGVRLQKEKCLFGATELPYLGYIVSKEGRKTSPEKVAAVNQAKHPKNLSALWAFRRTTEHGNADVLSRFPMRSRKKASPGLAAEEVYHTEFFSATISAEDVKRETEKDPELVTVRSRLQTGWRPEESNNRFGDLLPEAVGVISRRRHHRLGATSHYSEEPPCACSITSSRRTSKHCEDEDAFQELRLVARLRRAVRGGRFRVSELSGRPKFSGSPERFYLAYSPNAVGTPTTTYGYHDLSPHH